MIKFIEPILSYDKYVPVRYIPPFEKLCNVGWLQKSRIQYWNNLASRYPPFKGFYDKQMRDEIVGSSHIQSQIKDIFHVGTSFMGPVLNSNELAKLSLEIEDLRSKKKFGSKIGYVQQPVKCEELRSTFMEKLFPLHQFFFNNRAIGSPIIDIRIDWSEDGNDPSPEGTAGWHIDRFLPTLNAIYFPYGAEWGVFEKDFGNPIINQNDLDSYLDFSVREDGDPVKYIYRDLGRSPKLCSASANEMVVGTHHLQHRRSPYKTPGERVAVFIDHYNFFPMGGIKKC